MKFAISCLFSLLFVALVFSQERIISYDSHIKVETSGDLLVREDITVVAEGNQIKRGIYRTFPTKYKDKLGTRFNVDFDVVDVLRDGNKEPFFTQNIKNGVQVYIGDETTFLSSGTYTYSIFYKTTRQIGFFEDYDELYFNAIGGDWVFPIEKATVLVELPEGAEVLQLDAFSGVQGTTTCDCELVSGENRIKIETTRALNPREQLTFAVAWPKGIVKEPTTAEKWMFFFKSNFHVLFSIISLLFVGMVYYFAWKKVGVDPPKGTIFPQFDPPEGFSPADCVILQRLNFSQRAFSAAIVNMAVKGYLKINYDRKQYTLNKVSEDDSLLTEEEKELSRHIFSKSNSIELNNKNYLAFSGGKAGAYNKIKKKLKPTYFSFNSSHLIKGILASVILVIIAFIIAPSPAIPILLTILLVVLVVIFTYLIKAPTVLGRKIMDDIEGFKMYLSVAEQKRLDSLQEPKMTVERFEALLPYAIALGVENKWGKKFENSLAKSLRKNKSYNPSWYTGAATGMAFSPAKFSSDMGRSFSSAISSASTPPGRSSGSGGGGSSGGGGGGGGGGGW